MLRRLFFYLLFTQPLFAQYSKTHLVDSLPYAVVFDFTPDGRIFATQQGTAGTRAQIRVFDSNGNFLSVFYDLNDSTWRGSERGLLGITMDPNFASNHYVYVFYNYNDSALTPNPWTGDDRVRVQRFTEAGNIGTQPTIILDLDVPDSLPPFHTGGNIHFRPSDSTHIYVSIGDMFTGYSGDAPARVDNPLGKILRISKYPGAPPPSDNPFYDDGNPYIGNCDYIWAYGLRNTFDFCFGPNDSLYATENGTYTFDEVNLITRGGFYGWPYCEGSVDGDTLTIPCHAANSILPIYEFPSPLPALTGIIFYTDTVFGQQQNRLITGDFNHANLHSFALGNVPAYDQVDSVMFWIDESMVNGITCLRQGSQGCIYVMEMADSITGGVYMICPDATAIADHAISPLHIQGANPFHEETILSYSLHASMQINCTLYDSFGRMVTVLCNQQQAPGLHQLTINARQLGLAAGMYTCVLRHANGTSTQRLIVE